MASNKLPAKSATHKIGEYSLINSFPGYNARGDKTTLPIGTLVSPSKNVLIKTSGRLASVSGYTLDGTGSSIIDSGILSHFDFINFKGDVRNMRAGFLTSAGNDGKLQYRYITGTSTVNWINLATGLTNVVLSYTEFWDNTALVKNVLWVDGSNNIFKWNGAITTFASATAAASGVIVQVAVSPTNGGTGYVIGDLLTISGGTLATVRVTNASGGVISAISLVDPGTGGYSVGSGIATTGGTGTGATIQISVVGSASTVTKQGTLTWAQEGFSQGSGSIVINGTSYTYTGSGTSTTLQGVTPDPSGAGYSAGKIIHQGIVTTPLSAMTAISSTFAPNVIGCGRRNQVYVGSSTSNNLYISKVNTFTDYGFTSPVRIVGEGALISLDAPPTKFIALENRNDTNAYDLYISEGLSTWGVIRATLSSDLSKETLEHIRMKVSYLQGAKSERFATKMKNHIMFLGNDSVANFMGYISYQYVPEIVDFSYPIIDDLSSYDFTNGSIFYYKNYVYLTIPKSGIIRIYNMTDQTKQTTSSIRGVEDVDSDQPWFWETPVTYPISGFYVTPDKGLCGHSYTTSESYQLFTGGSFNGQQIETNITLSYDDKGDRTQSKMASEIFVEGFIKQNTLLNTVISGDLDSFSTSQTVVINGSDTAIVAYGSGGNAIGKNPLGSEPLGGSLTSTTTLPAWFHCIKTFGPVPNYLEKISFNTKGVDLQYELICFGTNSTFTAEGNNSITQ